MHGLIVEAYMRKVGVDCPVTNSYILHTTCSMLQQPFESPIKSFVGEN